MYFSQSVTQNTYFYYSKFKIILKQDHNLLDVCNWFLKIKPIPVQPAFLVKWSSNLEHLHRNTWKILTRKAASFAITDVQLLFYSFPTLLFNGGFLLSLPHIRSIKINKSTSLYLLRRIIMQRSSFLQLNIVYLIPVYVLARIWLGYIRMLGHPQMSAHLLQKPQRFTFLRRNRVRRTGFEFQLNSCGNEHKSCASNSIPAQKSEPPCFRTFQTLRDCKIAHSWHSRNILWI